MLGVVIIASPVVVGRERVTPIERLIGLPETVDRLSVRGHRAEHGPANSHGDRQCHP